MIKLGINGFGRIGRMVFRAAVANFGNDIQVVGINDLLDADYLAYMLKYDSVHGRFDGEVAVEDGALVVNGNKIRLTAEMDPANLKWNEVDADVVVESTGFFLTELASTSKLALRKLSCLLLLRTLLLCSFTVLTIQLTQVKTLSLTLLVLLTAWLLSLRF